MENLKVGDLRIELGQSEEGQIVLTWLGKSNDRHPGSFLSSYFNELAAEAKNRTQGIVLRFEQLEYFNSSTISAVVRLLKDLRDLKIPVKITYDGKVRSQRLSFLALKPLEALDGQVSVVDVSDF